MALQPKLKDLPRAWFLSDGAVMWEALHELVVDVGGFRGSASLWIEDEVVKGRFEVHDDEGRLTEAELGQYLLWSAGVLQALSEADYQARTR